MEYTLITKTGKVMTFYVKSVADLYQTLNGGVVITQQILVDELAKAQYNTYIQTHKGAKDEEPNQQV